MSLSLQHCRVQVAAKWQEQEAPAIFLLAHAMLLAKRPAKPEVVGAIKLYLEQYPHCFSPQVRSAAAPSLQYGL